MNNLNEKIKEFLSELVKFTLEELQEGAKYNIPIEITKNKILAMYMILGFTKKDAELILMDILTRALEKKEVKNENI